MPLSTHLIVYMAMVRACCGRTIVGIDLLSREQQIEKLSWQHMKNDSWESITWTSKSRLNSGSFSEGEQPRHTATLCSRETDPGLYGVVVRDRKPRARARNRTLCMLISVNRNVTRVQPLCHVPTSSHHVCTILYVARENPDNRLWGKDGRVQNQAQHSALKFGLPEHNGNTWWMQTQTGCK